MILSVCLPRLSARAEAISIHKVMATEGDLLRTGAPLVEVRIDIETAQARDCPPVMFFRLIATERAYLRKLTAVVGQRLPAESPLGSATTHLDEPDVGIIARRLRITAIVVQVDPLS